MADQAIVDRLEQVQSLKGVPRAELEWLADNGVVARIRGGTVMKPGTLEIQATVEGTGVGNEVVRGLNGEVILGQGMVVVLQGHLSIHVEQGACTGA